MICLNCKKECIRNSPRQLYCSKECKSIYQRRPYLKNYYQKNKKRLLEYMKDYWKEHKEERSDYAKNIPKEYRWQVKNKKKYLELCKKSRLRNPNKAKARAKAEYIKIPEGKLCEICNKSFAIEKHHPDYSKPKDVKFLCKQCHEDLHHPKD